MPRKERMFRITCEDIVPILHDYHIPSKIKDICELQRYAYERNVPNSREVRLIVKVELVNATSLVIRFKNEHDVTLELIEKQCRFADTLKKNGIPTPNQYKSNDRYANWYTINGYDVIVTIEQFVENEVKVVDTIIARKTGELLAKTHNVAEQNQIHIQNNVLFNPFCPNDLFSFDDFKTLAPVLQGEDELLFDKISKKYHIYENSCSVKSIPEVCCARRYQQLQLISYR